MVRRARSATWVLNGNRGPRDRLHRVTDVSRIPGTRRTREDTRYVGFGTVRPRGQIPGPRPVFEYDSGLATGPQGVPDHSRITISKKKYLV